MTYRAKGWAGWRVPAGWRWLYGVPFVAMPLGLFLVANGHFGSAALELLEVGLVLAALVGVVAGWLSPYARELETDDRRQIRRRARAGCGLGHR